MKKRRTTRPARESAPRAAESFAHYDARLPVAFHASRAFFPRTAAWNDLRRALGRDYDDSVWEHLAGTTSAPFEAGEHRQIAVKVIDDRGNELLVVKSLKDLRA
jgi:adenine-specific DNA-methyltransferase